MPRKYTVDEIGKMRECVELMVPDYQSGPDRTVAVEERLRTYMANGTELFELELATATQRTALAMRLRAMARDI